MDKNVQKRLKNPMFLLALAGLVYQALQKYMDIETYKTLVDIISYVAIGAGVYSNFGQEEK